MNMNNIRYLTGFSGSDGALLVGGRQAALLVDGRYAIQAVQETHGIKIVEYRDKIKGIGETVGAFHLKKVGLESDSITLDFYKKLAESLGEETFLPLSEELRFLRACKDAFEVALMRKAAEIASSSMLALLNSIKPGRSERDLALQLEITAREKGADGLAFEAIVASGENAALPHAKPTDRKITKGDLVVVDFGVKYKGYCSDETCTVAIGKLTALQKNAYRLVLEAQQRALESVRDGVAAADIDRKARAVFGEKYGRYFVHGTGHGVGLEVHEAPRVGASSGDILKTGMTLTVEPGIYMPGR
ncbi:MAG TPA: aminopeptidase P family protein, partial [Smithella sp.]|nr:aminopeptidase P family protein [Smithella sp.]